MNIKRVILGLIVILLIILGITKIMGMLKESKEVSTTYMKEAIGLKTKAKGLVEQSEKQVKEREKILDKE